MRNTKKAISILLALLMVVGMMSTFAFAAGNGSITISNASKGEDYEAYKIFDAKVDTATNGITYQEISTDQIKDKNLAKVFEKNKAGDVVIKANATNQEIIAAVKAYIAGAELSSAKKVNATGNTAIISGLDYGYYYITSGLGSVISITSTNPTGTVEDKNTTEPGPTDDPVKKSDKNNVFVGDTVTYTVKFNATNYYNATEGTAGKQIKQYVIKDTLPSFLADVNVISLKIGNKTITPAPQFNNKEIRIDWVDADNNSIYSNNTVIEIKYTAKVVASDDIVYNGNGNKNDVSIGWNYVGGGEENGKITGSDTIYTFAIALKKVNKDGTPLTGAKFKIPFAAEKNADGVWTVTGEGSTEVNCDSKGVVLVKGVTEGTHMIEESVAPDGYNVLKDSFEAKAVKDGTITTTWVKYIKDGITSDTEIEGSTKIEYTNSVIAASVTPVVNYTGTELPSTGGIGTTIFYLIGAILVIGAGVVCVTRRRMHSDK